MRHRKKRIKLPLSIPQNIIDILVEYHNWRKDQSKYPQNHKETILDKLSEVCRRWHLFSGYESCGASKFIYTNVGICVYTHIDPEEPLTIKQCSMGKNYNPWSNDYPQDTEGRYATQSFIYDWTDYQDIVIETPE